MEKSGRHGLTRKNRRLLIAVACLLLAAVSAYSFEADIRVSSYDLRVGDTLRVEIVVRDAQPATTSATPLNVPSSFIPGASSKEKRIVEDANDVFGTHVELTVIAAEWKVTESGAWAIGPFTITSRNESLELPPVYVTVTLPGGAKDSPAALRWVVPEGPIRTGKAVHIVLEGQFPGKKTAVSCPAPENALLESHFFAPGSVQPSAPGWTVVAIWAWTPLGEGMESLPRAVLEYTTATGAVRSVSSEPLSVQVARGSVSSQRSAIPKSLKAIFADTGSGSVPAPRVAKEKDLETAARLHDLRRLEYTTLFPRSQRLARQAMEDELGISETFPVPPAAWKPLAVIGSVLSAFLALILRLVASSPVPVRSLFRRLSVPVAIVSLLLAIFAVTLYTQDLKTAGVVTGADLLHVPEANSTLIENLRSGTPVRVIRQAGDWLFVETPSSIDGWIPSGSFLDYTTMERKR
jgi:hypothetical protein